MSVDQESHFLSLLTDPDYHPSLSFNELEMWAPGTAEGIIIGGCLSIIAASIGTCYEIKTEGKILFIEDQGEPPYRLDRMLTHLRLAGKLDSVGGILLGNFPDCDNGKYTASEVLRDILSDLNIPILAHFPAGHGIDNWAIPLGSKIRLDANAKSIEFLHPAVTANPGR
jgi:muramoyltetrapeptide carboxypeptidase